MGLHDRPYWRDDTDRSYQDRAGLPGIRRKLRRPPPATLGLIIVYVVLFLLTVGAGEGSPSGLATWLALTTDKVREAWRFVTFQFLQPSGGHLLFAILVLFFFAPHLERHWGWKKFLLFYLVCGAVGGPCYLLMTSLWPARVSGFCWPITGISRWWESARAGPGR